MEKVELRRELRARLLKMTDEQRSDKSKKACKYLIETAEWQQSAVIMIYLSLPHEVDTAPAILHGWQQGKTVVVPKVSWQQRHMIAVEINSLETGFSVEVGGLRNPVTGAPMPVEEIGLVVTPGLAFDKQGGRLGRGSGYYDEFFHNLQLKAAKSGLSFAEQVVDKVPVHDHDSHMDLLVTDEGVTYFEKG